MKNWHLQSVGCRVIAYGNVCRHSDFLQGQKIHTSYITNMEETEDAIRIDTYVGNSYLLSKADENQRKAIQTKHGFVLLEKWLEKERKKEQKRALL